MYIYIYIYIYIIRPDVARAVAALPRATDAIKLKSMGKLNIRRIPS